MEALEQAINNLIEVIKNTDTYKTYKRELEKVGRFPELKAQIDTFRQRNFELQTMADDENLFYRLEEFEREYEKFRENPMVSDFLAAELDLCRMMQDVSGKLTDSLDFS